MVGFQNPIIFLDNNMGIVLTSHMSDDVITSKDLNKTGSTGVARLEEESLEQEVKKEMWSALQPATQFPQPEWDELLVEKKKKEKEPKRKKK